MSASPTERTLQECRRRGWHAGVVERWNPHANRRIDLFGCIDVIAVNARGFGALGIQATSKSNMSARVEKAKGECHDALYAWLRAGNAFEVWGWAKRKKPVEGRWWNLRRVAVLLRHDRMIHKVRT